MLDERKNVAMRRVLRALGERGVFGRCELAFEPIQQAVDDQSLPFIQLHIFYALPEARFLKHSA